MCLKKSFLFRLLENLIRGLYIKNVRKSCTAKNYSPVSLLSMVCKIFEKIVNNWLIDLLEKYVPSDFQHNVKSSLATVDRLTADRIASNFNRSGLIKLQHLIYSIYKVLVLSCHFLVIGSLELFWVVSLQGYPVYVVFFSRQSSRLLFSCYSNDLLGHTICNIGRGLELRKKILFREIVHGQ